MSRTVLHAQALLAADSPVMLMLQGYAAGAFGYVRTASAACMLASAALTAAGEQGIQLLGGDAAKRLVHTALLDAARQV